MAAAALITPSTRLLLRVEGEPDTVMTLARFARELAGSPGFFLPDVVKALARGDAWLGDVWSVERVP